jgi:hypothetical protein
MGPGGPVVWPILSAADAAEAVINATNNKANAPLNVFIRHLHYGPSFQCCSFLLWHIPVNCQIRMTITLFHVLPALVVRKGTGFALPVEFKFFAEL